ncbi:MAG: NAD-dependent epimerase/dehydratase family protein [Myxococcales bacterium]|nr:NAD-dependent epimerase/dehydratase family protein [Myxococcales bacterium]MCB9748952.1 NAD-dependent epimerase/dehydratase family protein [Myxococcales bacterium]
MKILVTGSGGQVGQDLIRGLLERGHEVHGSDVASRPSALGLGDRELPWHLLDVTDLAALRRLIARERPDIIYHLAAILSARGEENPGLTYRVNQGGVYNVLEASREHRVSQVLFASTIAVFGPGLPDPVPDDVHLQPTTMYGVTKVGGELLGEYYNKRYGLDFRAVRFPGLISATLPGGGTSDYAPLMYVESMRTGAYEAFCRADTRIPMMYMPDGIRALIELSEAPRDRLQRTTYNIAAFSPTAEEIADSVARAVPGARITFKSDPTRQAILDSWPNALDDAHARVDWGWAPEFDLERMTEDLVPKLRALLRVNAS